jgi:plasmid maintenance system antidote protein VapI
VRPGFPSKLKPTARFERFGLALVLLRSPNSVRNGKALRIEKAFGVKMDTLMRMQASYDIAQTRKREKQIHVRRVSQLVHA